MKSLFPVFSILFSLLLLNCQKTVTTARGRVFNYISGKPIANMPVSITGYDGFYPRDSRIPNPCETVQTLTDINGAYELEVDCSGMDQVSMSIGKASHTNPFYNGFFSGKPNSTPKFAYNNVIDFQIDSIDGKINFNFHNLKAVYDTVFFLVQCNALFEGPFLYCGGHNEIGVDAGDTYSRVWFITANRHVKYYWDTVPFTGINATHVDSIYCARNDSITCNISF